MTALWQQECRSSTLEEAEKAGTVAILSSRKREDEGGNAHISVVQDPSDVRNAMRSWARRDRPIGSSAEGAIICQVQIYAPRPCCIVRGYGAGAPQLFGGHKVGGVLYAAFYNGGGATLNVRGNLGSAVEPRCLAAAICEVGRELRRVQGTAHRSWLGVKSVGPKCMLRHATGLGAGDDSIDVLMKRAGRRSDWSTTETPAIATRERRALAPKRWVCRHQVASAVRSSQGE